MLSKNNPSTDSGCATSVSTTNYFKCIFVAGTRSGDCEEPKKRKIFTRIANLSSCYYSYGCGYTTYITSDTGAECYEYENISWDDYMPTCTACSRNVSRYKIQTKSCNSLSSKKGCKPKYKTVTEITVSCPSGQRIFEK